MKNGQTGTKLGQSMEKVWTKQEQAGTNQGQL